MSHADHIQDELSSASVAVSECSKAGKSRAAANMAAADAYAASLRRILFELLVAPSHGKRRMRTGWQLSEVAEGLNQRGFRTRTGKLFRPMTVMRLLVRMSDVAKAARFARQTMADGNLRLSLGIKVPTGATEVIAGMNTSIPVNSMMGTPKV